MDSEPSLRPPRRPPRLSFELRTFLLAVAVGLPGTAAALLLLWLGPYSDRVRWIFSAVLAIAWWILANNLRQSVVRPLQTLSNILQALRKGDFSLRARLPRQPADVDALGQVMLEVNAIGATLQEQRLGAVEATALLHRVMEEVDVAIFALDDHSRLQVVNRAGERLLDETSERLRGRSAADLGLGDVLAESAPRRIVAKTFPGGFGRWEIRRSTFREGGLPHMLVVVSDLTETLREEERQAWKRLLRVLGHELNNSLAPIRSMASTLAGLLTRQPRPGDWEEDMQSGLEIIGNRSEALSRFMAAYARLARLPPPRLATLELSALIRRVAALESRLPVFVERGQPVTLQGDADQLEQLLINLVRNAVDAALETHGGVGIGWHAAGDQVEVRIEDEGLGISNPENLFVPFYTTKQDGTGIGLALSRQIAEAHGGTLTLENRRPGPGCEAVLRLPRRGPDEAR